MAAVGRKMWGVSLYSGNLGGNIDPFFYSVSFNQAKQNKTKNTSSRVEKQLKSK